MAPPTGPLAPAIHASPHVLALLATLHAQATAEAPFVSTGSSGDTQALTLDRFVALDADKCAFVYLLLRSSGARWVVEAGTSFGLSTIYLALAVGQNAGSGGPGKVIATELAPSKAARAREHWAQAGEEEVGRWIELREGDLRETLKEDMPLQVDFLLLDIWTPLALPALKLVQPHMRKGAMVVADNVEAAKEGYRDLLAYVEDPENGFKTMNVPFDGGLQIIVYLGKE